jgi:phage terminase large subunit
MFNAIIEDWQLDSRIRKEKVMLDYYCGKSLLHFGSLDDPEKIKSSDWNYIWMEEANEFTYDDFRILKLRLRAPVIGNNRNQMYLSMNPTDEHHWIKKQLLDANTEDALEIQSTYKDNPFLSQDYINTLENLVHQDANYYRIYALGEWGRLEHLIYTNWKTTDTLPEGDETIYGLDYGYNNPTALVEIVFKDGKVYEKQLLYETKLTNKDLISQLKQLIPNRNKYIFADSAEPQRIEEIAREGFNILSANKSVKDGIDHVKTLDIHITSDSVDLIKEKQSYSWKQNKNGTVVDDPVKFNDHLVDAERYALYTYYKENAFEVGLRWM